MSMITRIELDPLDRRTRGTLASPERLHASIGNATDGGRVLWALDGHPALTVVSDTAPAEGVLRAMMGVKTFATTDYDRLLGSLTAGERYRFQLTAAPSKALKCEPGRSHGRLVPLRDRAQRLAWLGRKLGGAGMTVLEADVTAPRRLRFRHRTGSTLITSVTFTGLLRVDDPEQARAGLTAGFGRMKCWGQGLLLVAPAE